MQRGVDGLPEWMGCRKKCPLGWLAALRCILRGASAGRNGKAGNVPGVRMVRVAGGDSTLAPVRRNGVPVEVVGHRKRKWSTDAMRCA